MGRHLRLRRGVHQHSVATAQLRDDMSPTTRWRSRLTQPPLYLPFCGPCEVLHSAHSCPATLVPPNFTAWLKRRFVASYSRFACCHEALTKLVRGTPRVSCPGGKWLVVLQPRHDGQDAVADMTAWPKADPARRVGVQSTKSRRVTNAPSPRVGPPPLLAPPNAQAAVVEQAHGGGRGRWPTCCQSGMGPAAGAAAQVESGGLSPACAPPAQPRVPHPQPACNAAHACGHRRRRGRGKACPMGLSRSVSALLSLCP